MTKIEVMEITLTIQIFLKAPNPVKYPVIKREPPITIIKNGCQNTFKKEGGLEKLFLAKSISA
jgi:hypothetical protein